MSYWELNQRANRLARRLFEQGVGQEQVVSIVLDRGADLIVAVVAVFKTGGAYLPVDVRWPPKRIAQAVTNSASRVVVTTKETAQNLEAQLQEGAGSQRLRWVTLERLPNEEPWNEKVVRRSEGRNLAYVIYTSGSTGEPKGVMIEHDGMLNHLFAKISDLGLGRQDVVAQTASQCFDISVWQMLAALLVGGSVAVFGDEVTHDPGQLVREMACSGATVFETVPSVLQAIDEELRVAEIQPGALRNVRWLIVTGEAWPAEAGRVWARLYPHVMMMNAYGPTECSDDVTHHIVAGGQLGNTLPIPIGRAVQNNQLYVLDGEQELVPVRVYGQLHVGGVGVGRGYMNDGALTAEAFVPGRYGTAEGQRVYRTGDVVRYRRTGELEFLGRADAQVKLRGYRIELGEIEAILKRHEGVKEAVLLLAGSADKRLTAYVVPRGPELVSEQGLRSYLRERLPEYMTPGMVVLLQEMPMTPNGKVDRNRLPSVDLSRDTEEANEPPRTPVEELLAGIWADVLGLEAVGLRESFFDIGGHSLLATQVISRVRDALQLEVPLRSLFQNPSVSTLAASVLQQAPDPTKTVRIAEVLLRVARLSDTEVEAMVSGDGFSSVTE